jgi:hypothetical protein
MHGRYLAAGSPAISLTGELDSPDETYGQKDPQADAASRHCLGGGHKCSGIDNRRSNPKTSLKWLQHRSAVLMNFAILPQRALT